MIFKNNKYKSLIIAVLITIIVGIFAFKLIDNIGMLIDIIRKFISLSMVFVYGIIIAYILSPIVSFFEKRVKLSRNISITLTYAILLGSIILLAVYGIPGLIENIKEIGSNVPSYISSIEDFINNILEKDDVSKFINTAGIKVNIDMYIDKAGNLVMTAIEGSLLKMVTFSSVIVKFIIGLLVAIYILIDKERLLFECKRVLYLVIKKEKSEKIVEFIKTYNSMIGTYIGIKAIDSLIIGIMAFVLLNIVKSEYAILLAILVGITNMIPYFGPFVGEIIGFLINVFVSPAKGIIVFLTLFGLQMFDGWYLDPKLIGDKVGVRPFWIIYSVVIGGGFFGPLGMLLASPTAATIKIYYGKLLDKNKDIIDELTDYDNKKMNVKIQKKKSSENSRYSYFLQLEQFDEQLPQLQLPLDDFFIFLKIIYPEAITKIAVIIISK